MKIFKGRLPLWSQLTHGKAMRAPAGLAGASNYKSALLNAIVSFFGYFAFWNLDAINANFEYWVENPRSWFLPAVPWDLLGPAVRRHHVYAFAFLIVGWSLSFLMSYSVWSARRRARKSAQGQWYDKAGLTKEDLYGKSHGASKTERDKP